MLVLPLTRKSNTLFIAFTQEEFMQSFIQAGGPFMYLILLFAFIAAVLFVLRLIQVLREGGASVTTLSEARTVLHLGICSFLFGIIGQLTGLYQAAGAVLRATEISPNILARGIHVSFNTTLLGLYALGVCMLLWLVLRAVLLWRASTA